MDTLIPLLDSYLDGVEGFFLTHIVLAPLILLVIEEIGVPTLIPGDAVLGYVGYGLNNHPSVLFLEAFIMGMIAVVIGSSILFFLARRWGDLIVSKFGHYMFIEKAHIERAKRMFAKYGILTIIVGRHIPGMRAPITIFAAISGLRYTTFILSVLLSSSLWIVFYLYLGKHVGAHLQGAFRHYAGQSIAILVGLALIFVGLHYYGAYRRRRRK